MKTSVRTLQHTLLASACIACAGLVFPLPQPAIARDGDRVPIIVHDTNWDDDWGDFNQTMIQMQRESLSSQEEQAREAGRARRRDEIEKQQDKSSAEHEAYFDAILEDSQAALKAPLGVYYRKPGYSAAEGPGDTARTVEVGGLAYLYNEGIFWLHRSGDYVVATAPVGAAVDKLPQGVTRLAAKPGPVWYFFGTFFGEKNGDYEVIKPAPGLIVFYLPDGYSKDKVKGAGVYRFGDIFFKPVFIQGILAYQVVAP